MARAWPPASFTPEMAKRKVNATIGHEASNRGVLRLKVLIPASTAIMVDYVNKGNLKEEVKETNHPDKKRTKRVARKRKRRAQQKMATSTAPESQSEPPQKTSSTCASEISAAKELLLQKLMIKIAQKCRIFAHSVPGMEVTSVFSNEHTAPATSEVKS